MLDIAYDKDAWDQAELTTTSVSADGEVVLNDKTLLELIEFYPFLYNANVKPYRDPDYDSWAWERITKSINKVYRCFEMYQPFTVEFLKKRWEYLQMIMLQLRKSGSFDEVPDALMQLFSTISSQLSTKAPDTRYTRQSNAQLIILSHIKMVEKLPLHRRRNLEADIIKLLLNNELNAKATVSEDSVEKQKLSEECDEFFREIGIVGEQKYPTIDLTETAKDDKIKEESKDDPLLTSMPIKVQKPMSVRRCVVRLKRFKLPTYNTRYKLRFKRKFH